MEVDRAAYGGDGLCSDSYIHGWEMGYTLCLSGSWL